MKKNKLPTNKEFIYIFSANFLALSTQHHEARQALDDWPAVPFAALALLTGYIASYAVTPHDRASVY